MRHDDQAVPGSAGVNSQTQAHLAHGPPLPLPLHTGCSRHRAGGADRGLELKSRGHDVRPRAHLPGMGDKVIHGNLDCFPFRDFFECLEDEFIVKGI